MSSAGSRPTFHQLDRPGQDKVQAKATASDGRMPAAGAAGPRGRGWAGLALAAASAAAFGTSGTFATSLIGAGWSPAAAVLARIAVAACQLFYFNAIARMPVGVALLLEYLGPVLVVGWLWARHGQRPRTLTVAGAAASLSGLVLVLNLTGRAHLDPLGVMWGLLAACGLAVYFVLSAHGGGQLPPLVLAWAGMCAGAVTLAAAGAAGLVPMAATTRDTDLLGHRASWLVSVLGLSLVAAAFAYAAGITAARRLGPKLASFVGMAEVLFAILFAWLALGQLPTVMQFAGGAFIVAGVTLVRLDESRQ